MKLNEKMFQEEILSVVFVCSPADKPTNQQLDTGENRTLLVEHTKQNSPNKVTLKEKKKVMNSTNTDSFTFTLYFFLLKICLKVAQWPEHWSLFIIIINIYMLTAVKLFL